jgi:hypothetical protein
MVEKIIEQELREINDDSLRVRLPKVIVPGVIAFNLLNYDYSKLADLNIFSGGYDLLDKSLDGALITMVGSYLIGKNLDKRNASFDNAARYFKNGAMIGLGIGALRLLNPTPDLDTPVQVASAVVSCGGIGAVAGLVKDMMIQKERKPYGCL